MAVNNSRKELAEKLENFVKDIKDMIDSKEVQLSAKIINLDEKKDN